MPYKNLLVHLDDLPACNARMQTALALAGAQKARLTGLYAVAVPNVPSLSSRDRRSSMEHQAEQAAARFRKEADSAGIDLGWQSYVATNDSRVRRRIIRCAKRFDLAILGQFDPATADGSIPPHLVEQTVIQSGRPVLVVPFAGRFPSVGKRAIIAWNESREATRALNDALPLLTGAEFASVLVLSPDRNTTDDSVRFVDDIVGHLGAHGVKAETNRLVFDPDHIDLGDRLLSHLADMSADLLVMGAWGREDRRLSSRGSLTGYILAHMTAPLLLSR